MRQAARMQRKMDKVRDSMKDKELSATAAGEKVTVTVSCEGKLRRIWRIPGRRAVYALYRLEGPDELHEVLSSLPLFPWMDIEITALGAHALDPES